MSRSATPCGSTSATPCSPHAMATGDYNYAQELEEEMKMMRFNWGKEKQHMEVG